MNLRKERVAFGNAIATPMDIKAEPRSAPVAAEFPAISCPKRPPSDTSAISTLDQEVLPGNIIPPSIRTPSEISNAPAHLHQGLNIWGSRLVRYPQNSRAANKGKPKAPIPSRLTTPDRISGISTHAAKARAKPAARMERSTPRVFGDTGSLNWPRFLPGFLYAGLDETTEGLIRVFTITTWETGRYAVSYRGWLYFHRYGEYHGAALSALIQKVG